MNNSLSVLLKMQFALLVVATDVFKSEQCYTPAHHSSLHRATVLTDDVLIYGTLNQLSEALSSLSSLIMSCPQMGCSGPVRPVCCLFPKSNTTYLVAVGSISSWVFWPAMEIDCKI